MENTSWKQIIEQIDFVSKEEEAKVFEKSRILIHAASMHFHARDHMID